MTKFVALDWKIPVDQQLIQGSICDRWTEEKEQTDYEVGCKFFVDEDGFFVAWKSDSREGDVVEISTVNDIRPGSFPNDQRLKQNLISKHGTELDKKSFAICSGINMVNVSLCNVICSDVETAEVWRKGLQKIILNKKMNNACPKVNLTKHWKRILLTTTVDSKVSVKAIAKTFASGKTEKQVYDKLESLGLPSDKNASMSKEDLTFDKFYELYQTICPRTDIDDLFKSITKTETITAKNLADWMNENQRDSRLNQILFPQYNLARCTEIITMHEPDEEIKKRNELSKSGLTQYMLSDENAPVILDRLEIYQDMDQPLPHYYVNSSHNSYLTGKQFGGKSSVEIYRQILLSGCRCVELDCWDGKGQDEGDVIITHGHAMCTNVYFKDVIQAIADTAFQASEYPVILSFENHCNRSNQLKMARFCIDIFGDLLLKEPLPDYPVEKGKSCPPPSRLKRKILIKNKRLKPEVEKVELEMFLKGELKTDDDVSEDTAGASAAEKKEEETDDGTDMKPVAPVHTGSTLNVHPLLSSIVNYTHPTHFNGFDAAEEADIHYKMSSFAEPAALGYLKTQAIEFVNYNKRQISRLYPKGARVDSSNFLPQIFWNAGCQLVSLNFQTPDLPMQLNQGKFEFNGNCGYLLKPEFMRKADKTFDPFAETPVDGVIAACCSVQIISGQFISPKREGTYVEVDMYGLPTDTIKKEFKTKTVPANGLNPFYNEEPFEFRKVVLPELAVLRFGVYNEEGKLLGQRILPFDDLQMGYRHISLKTESNFPMSLPMLFVNIQVKVYVPDGLGDFMDALCDPRAFLSAQEKRAEQMKALGIEESDISGDVIVSSGDKKEKGTGGVKSGTKEGKSESKKQEFLLDVITCDTMKTEKVFVKRTKKFEKEKSALLKKHTKERDTIISNQCKKIEQVCKGKKLSDANKDPEILKTIDEQVEQWTEMVRRHRCDLWKLDAAQMQGQEDIFKSVFLVIEQRQTKDLITFQAKETKDMMSNQIKVSVETAKEVQNDASLKTKAEKDRRLREKNQNNTKKFLDERKNTTIKQNKLKEKQRKLHEKQLAGIGDYIKESILMMKVMENSQHMADHLECYV